MSVKSQKLFTPAQLGPLSLSHRIVMAPLTRLRSDVGDVPTDLMALYYGQRSSAGGLIISEATTISNLSRGYLGAPGIFTDEQVVGWRNVVKAVHAKGGVFFQQLWHVGRVAHTSLTGGEAPLAPSALPYEGMTYTAEGWQPASPGREIATVEIPVLVEQYRQAAERAMAAGFDGVEIHGGNGYLIDQFLNDGSNHRSDNYGGTIANRSRFLLEVTQAVISVWGAQRVGVRISPNTSFNSMTNSNSSELFHYVGEELNKLGIAYLHIIEPRIKGSEAIADGMEPVAAAQLRKVFSGTIIAAGGFEPLSAEAIVQNGDADLVAFGRHFIANPDLPLRIQHNLPLNPYDRDTFYGGNARGYVDYPFALPVSVS